MEKVGSTRWTEHGCHCKKFKKSSFWKSNLGRPVRNLITRGIFVTECAETPSQKLFLRRRKPERRSGALFYLKLVQLTPSLSDRILGHSLRSGTSLLRKITLLNTTPSDSALNK
jgi:hypothetical protein